jgi:hypothetical protein
VSDWARYLSSLAPPPAPPAPVKRKVFVSYCHSDQQEAEWFVWNWRNVFTHRALGMSFTKYIVDRDNTAYVMSRIRSEYLGDSSVTVVLMGNCTHSRRFIDWEIKASLQRGTGTPNGLLAFLLPSAHNRPGLPYPYLPTRFAPNYRHNDNTSYARYWFMPYNEAWMRQCIEAAFESRTNKKLVDDISNPNEMMKNNGFCYACGVNHGI